MSSPASYLVIGGSGFLGQNLVKALVARYPQAAVAATDIERRHEPAGYTFHTADLTDAASLERVLRETAATVVFHTASPRVGSSRAVCELVNVRGTENVVAACRTAGVRTLVYTSSASVVFDGGDLVNVDERLSVDPAEGAKFFDVYAETKARAELVVLKANDPAGLRTVALRPAGIFGPGDGQLIPPLMEILRKRQTRFQLGSNRNLFDWTYVDNLVDAHLLAAERIDATVPRERLGERTPPVELTLQRRALPTSVFRVDGQFLDDEERDDLATSASGHKTEGGGASDVDGALYATRNRLDQFSRKGVEGAGEDIAAPMRVAGQAFFITNGEPLPFWDICRMIWFEYNGHVPPQPYWALPRSLAGVFARAAEAFGYITGREVTFKLPKVILSCARRYYNIERARILLGYEPKIGVREGIKRHVAVRLLELLDALTITVVQGAGSGRQGAVSVH